MKNFLSGIVIGIFTVIGLAGQLLLALLPLAVCLLIAKIIWGMM